MEHLPRETRTKQSSFEEKFHLLMMGRAAPHLPVCGALSYAPCSQR